MKKKITLFHCSIAPLLKKKRPAFTLLELLVVVTILGLVMVAVTQLLAAVLSNSSKSSASQSVKENGQFALSSIEKTVRRATRVTTCSGSRLAVIVSEAGQDVTYTYNWDGTTADPLTRTTAPPLSPGTNLVDPVVQVTAFSCTLTPGTTSAPPVVSIILTLEKPSLSADQNAGQQTLTASISLRTY